MPRVHTKTRSTRGKAKQCGRCGAPILPGERYFTWSFYRAGSRTNCNLHPPRQSELTQSLIGEVWSAIEGAEDDIPKAESIDDIQTSLDAVAEAANDVAQQYQDAAEPFGGEGEHAERAEELESFASEVEGVYFDEEDGDLETAKEEALAVLELDL